MNRLISISLSLLILLLTVFFVLILKNMLGLTEVPDIIVFLFSVMIIALLNSLISRFMAENSKFRINFNLFVTGFFWDSFLVGLVVSLYLWYSTQDSIIDIKLFLDSCILIYPSGLISFIGLYCDAHEEEELTWRLVWEIVISIGVLLILCYYAPNVDFTHYWIMLIPFFYDSFKLIHKRYRVTQE
ncbi:MAG: hypothetical protein CME63_09750 [Halobacteriovoraceae bacterium]|nr:hypothetical protein [Halobacteriovoraceae bacterium]